MSDRVAWLVLFGAALAVRGLHLEAIADGPLSVAAHSPPWDSYYYHQAAWSLASGSLAGREAVEFVSSPVYLGFLTACFRGFGHDLLVPRVLQVLLGAVAAVLVALLGRRVFGPRAGWLAGAMAAFYGPLVFYDAELLKASLGVLLVVVGLALALRAGEAAETKTPLFASAASGLALGASVLIRGNVAALLPVVALWLALARGSARVPRVLAFAAGAALLLAPFGLRGALLPEGAPALARGLGLHLYIGNHGPIHGSYTPVKGIRADARGHVEDARRLAEEAQGRPLSADEVSDYWLARARAEVAREPGRAVRRALRKLRLFASAYEVPSNEDYYLAKEHSWVLRGPRIGFGFAAPLGFAGLGLALLGLRRRDAGIRQREGVVLLAAVLGTLALSLVPLFVTARYRLAAVPIVLVFAGYGLDRLVAAWRAGGVKSLAAPLAACLLLGLLVNAPTPLPRDAYERKAHAQLLAALEGRLDPTAPDLDEFLDSVGLGEPPRGDLVLVVVDTLRADHLPCYGYERATASAFCGLAEDGVLFERAFTPRSQTTPAVASMLTGLAPYRHGVRELGQMLPDAVAVLPERLAAAGYRTGAFVSSFILVDAMSGLGRGFEVYDDALTRAELYRENYERSADQTVARALAWLAESEAPAFLFVHLIEPHGPYAPPPGELEPFMRAGAGPRALRVPDYQRVPGVRFVSEYVDRYDAEIAVADRAVARLLDALREAGRFERATIALVADHGESFGEDGRWFEHGASVGAAETRVPLVVKFAAGQGATGARVGAPVSVADIAPTLLVAAGLEAPPGGHPLAGRHEDERVVLSTAWDDRGFVLAAHGLGCTVRWVIPSGYLDEQGRLRSERPDRADASWRGVAHRLQAPDAKARDEACASQLESRASEPIAELLRHRRDFVVSARPEIFQPGFRVGFVARRGDPVLALTPDERERLQQLGYVSAPAESQ